MHARTHARTHIHDTHARSHTHKPPSPRPQAGQSGNYAEFARQAAGASPEWTGRGSSYGFMNSWNIKRRGVTTGAAEEPQPGAAADPTGAAMILVNKGDSR